jgi:hypothetical protein
MANSLTGVYLAVDFTCNSRVFDLYKTETWKTGLLTRNIQSTPSDLTRRSLHQWIRPSKDQAEQLFYPLYSLINLRSGSKLFVFKLCLYMSIVADD